MSTKKKQSQEQPQPEPQVEETETPEPQPSEPTLESTSTPSLTPNPDFIPIPPDLNLSHVYTEVVFMEQVLSDVLDIAFQIQEHIMKKRTPAKSNGKVQIRDKQTGTVYPSKNNTFQSLLKSGDLKELVDQGLLGDNPSENTFGWYILVR